MERKKEYPRRTGPNNAESGGPQRNNNEHSAPREGYKPMPDQQPRNFRENRESREAHESRENRENTGRFVHHSQNSSARHTRVRVEETIDDIKEDITRIEKEITLEIKEIKSLKLGM